MTKLVTTVLMTTLAMSLVCSASAAEREGTLTAEEISVVQENFTKAGIDEKTQVKLLTKLNKGKKLDVNNPAMKDKGTYTKKEYIDENGMPVYEGKVTYPDGSVDFMTISEGTKSCGTGYCTYKNRLVSRWSGYIHAYFHANYTIVNGADDYISSVYDWSVSGAGSLANLTLEVYRTKEAYGDPAYAYLRFTDTAPNGLYTTTFYLRLYVGGDRAWDTGNW